MSPYTDSLTSKGQNLLTSGAGNIQLLILRNDLPSLASLKTPAEKTSPDVEQSSKQNKKKQQ